MNATKIEWTKNPDGTQGYTWNPITGCRNGCEYCYARKLANGRLKSRYLEWSFHMDWATYCEIPQTEVEQMHSDPFYPRFWAERLEEPAVKYNPTKAGYMWKPHKARGVFCCDMSDLFGIGIPEDWTRQVLNVIDYCCQDRFYSLTKQPQNLVKFSPFPDNCWVGVSATNMKMLIVAINYLPFIKAKVKYLSFEPLLSWECPNSELSFVFEDSGINWLIIGALTSRNYWDLSAQLYNSVDTTASRIMRYGRGWTLQPKIEWVEEIVMAADKANVKVFLKNNLKGLFEIGTPYPWATDKLGFLRQEMPRKD